MCNVFSKNGAKLALLATASIILSNASISDANATNVNVNAGTVSSGVVLAGNGGHTVNVDGFVTTSTTDAIDLNGVSAGGLDNVVNISGEITGDAKGTPTLAIDGSDAKEIVTVTGTVTSDIKLDGGSDELTLDGGEIKDDIYAGSGNDTVTIKGGTLGGDIDMGHGDDKIILDASQPISLNSNSTLDGGTHVDSDTILIKNGSLILNADVRHFEKMEIDVTPGGTVTLDNKFFIEEVEVQSGALVNSVNSELNGMIRAKVAGDITNEGNILNTKNYAIVLEDGGSVVNSGRIESPNHAAIKVVEQSGRNNATSITNNGVIVADRVIDGSRNVETVFLNGLSVGDIDLKEGDDVVVITDQAVHHGDIRLGYGNDTVTFEGEVNGNISTGAGNDIVSANGAVLNGTLNLGTGSNVLTGSTTVPVSFSNTLRSGFTNSGSIETAGNILVQSNFIQTEDAETNLIINSDDVNSTGTSGVDTHMKIQGDADFAGMIKVHNREGANAANFTDGENYSIVSVDGKVIDSGVAFDLPTLTDANLAWRTLLLDSNEINVSIVQAALGCADGASLTPASADVCNALQTASQTTGSADLTNVIDALANSPESLEILSAKGYGAVYRDAVRSASKFNTIVDERVVEMDLTKPEADECGIWTRGSFDSYKDNGSHESSAMNVAAGRDCYSEDSMMGFAVGYTSGDVTENNGIDAKTTGYNAAAYGAMKLDDLRISGIVSYAQSVADIERSIDVSGIERVAKGDTATSVLSAKVEAGLEVNAGKLALTPFASAEYNSVSADAVTESGADTANLNVDAYSDARLTTNVGVRAAFHSKGFSPYGEFILSQDVTEQDEALTGTLAGSSYEAAINKRPSSRATLGLGFNSDLGAGNLFGSYKMDTSADDESATGHTATIGYKLSF